LQWWGEDPAAHWLAPDQWLFTSDRKTATDMMNQIDSTLAGQLHATTDMSSNKACFALAGTAARTLLAMGCGIDLHPTAFKTGQCVFTHFANVLLFIVAVKDYQFDLYVDSSQARYLSDWLLKAGEDPMTRDTKHPEMTA
jgi:sarcosine oxidase subunit gamma